MKIKDCVRCLLVSTILYLGIGIDVEINHMSNASLWEDIEMPKISYFEGFGFDAPKNKKVWTKAKQNAISGRQVLLEQVLKVIRTPMDLLNGDFIRMKKLIDVHLCEKSGFKPMKSFKAVSSRAPICSLGGTQEVNNCVFGVKNVLGYLKKNKVKSDEEIPKDGFIGVGSFNENWGWLSTHFLNRTTSWEFSFGTNTVSLYFDCVLYVHVYMQMYSYYCTY